MLLFVVSMTALTSCNKEAEQLIVGKWECVSASYSDDGVTFPTPDLKGMIWQFYADGSMVVTTPEGYTHEFDLIGLSPSYIILGNLLTISYTDYDGDLESDVYVIQELTKNKLLLKENDDDDWLSVEFKKIL